ncbi:hypothetical protein FRC16_004113 [Serendipita sp. 398]|nr:hypothetical protein FRC16_004113 [Serendipita sp. 398]
MSKSLDGYYQESGRGGRDGKDSDCILYYRGQDVSRLSGLVCGEQEGQVKLYDMLRFAQNVVDCRKLLFAQYFSASSSLSLSAWSAEGSQTLSPCGHCDNCTRSPDELERDKDVTVEAWKILQIVRTIKDEGGKATLSMLSDLVRGAGGGSFESSNGGKGKGKQKEKVPLDVDAICGGKVEMHKDDVERLLITLLLMGYLKEDYVPTSYSINVYLIPGNQEIRLSRLSLQDVQAGSGPRIIGTFPKREKRKRASTGKPRTKGKQKEATDEPPTRTSRLSTSKGKGRTSLNDVDEEGDKEDDDSEVLEPNIANWTFGRGPTGVLEALQNRGGVLARTGRGNNMRSSKRKRVTSSDGEEGEDEEEGMRERLRARSSRGSGAFPGEEDDEVDDSLPEHERVRVPTSDEEIDAIEDEWEVSYGHTAGVHHSRLGGGSQPEKKRLKTSSLREIDTMSVIELSD